MEKGFLLLRGGMESADAEVSWVNPLLHLDCAPIRLLLDACAGPGKSARMGLGMGA